MADLILQELRDLFSEDLSQILYDEKVKMFSQKNCHLNETERLSFGFGAVPWRMVRSEKERRKTC
jgi:hypothetical protein